MGEHVVVASAAKGKTKVKRSRQLEVGDKLEYLRSELDSHTEENLRAQLDRFHLRSFKNPKRLKTLKEHAEPKKTEEAKNHEEAKEAEKAEKHEEPKEAEEAEEHAEPKEAEEPKEQEHPKESARTLDGLRSKTVEAWYQDLLRNLKIVSALPKLTNSTIRDARKLFGVNLDNKVILRNPGYVGGNEDIVLLQFDPNFMSTEVVCRHPSCNNINPAAAKCGKRDLYLCPHHQEVLRNNISDALANESLKNSTSLENPEPGQFAGYTTLISLLEGAYRDPKNLKVQEAILNARNFLIITSTVLNPDNDNLGIVLPPVLEILKFILENRENSECLAGKAIPLLKKVLGMILSAFGIVYTWVSHALGNPGAQIGGGFGGFIGGMTSFATGPLGWFGGIAAGIFLGGLIGNGLYNLLWGQRQQETYELGSNRQLHNQYPMYHFHGDVTGRLDLHFEFH